MFKNAQHKFAVIDSYGNEQTESNLIKAEYKKEFQQRLESRKITPKYRNIQEITHKIFDTCSSISKVQNNQPEMTKDKVQSAIKTLLAHKCYDPAGLIRGDSFLSSVTKIFKKKTNTRTIGKSKYSNYLQRYKGSKKILNNYCEIF